MKKKMHKTGDLLEIRSMCPIFEYKNDDKQIDLIATSIFLNTEIAIVINTIKDILIIKIFNENNIHKKFFISNKFARNLY